MSPRIVRLRFRARPPLPVPTFAAIMLAAILNFLAWQRMGIPPYFGPMRNESISETCFSIESPPARETSGFTGGLS